MSVQSEVSRITELKTALLRYLVAIEEADGTESLDTLIGKAITIMSSYGDRITALEEKIKDAGCHAAASLFDIGMEDEYYVETETDAPDVISRTLNLDGIVTPVGTSGICWKKPEVAVSDIDWSSELDDNYDLTGTGSIQVRFGDAGTLAKKVSFKKPGEGKVYAACLSNANARIETGIAADYGYRYRVKGHTISGDMAVLADAFISTTQRATARILGTSQKIQAQWPVNRDINAADIGMNFQRMFEMTVGCNYLRIRQDGRTVTPYLSGHTASGKVGTDIVLMGSTVANYGNSVLRFAEIQSKNGQAIAHFAPYKIRGKEVVMVNICGLTTQQISDIIENGDNAVHASRIFRPTSGTLLEVTQAEDEW